MYMYTPVTAVTFYLVKLTTSENVKESHCHESKQLFSSSCLHMETLSTFYYTS